MGKNLTTADLELGEAGWGERRHPPPPTQIRRLGEAPSPEQT